MFFASARKNFATIPKRVQHTKRPGPGNRSDPPAKHACFQHGNIVVLIAGKRYPLTKGDQRGDRSEPPPPVGARASLSKWKRNGYNK